MKYKIFLNKILFIFVIIAIIGIIYYMKINNLNKFKVIQKEYSIKNTIKKNFLIKIKDGYSEEIININLMDNFEESIEIGQTNELFIIEYERNDTGEIVTALKKLNYDRNEIKVLKYDVSNQKEFKENKTSMYKKITRTGDNFGIRIIGTTSETQPIMDGDILFQYTESNIVEYK